MCALETEEMNTFTLELDDLIKMNRQEDMDRKRIAAKQYLADRGIAALGPNSTFIYTDSKGERHERTTTRRPRVLPASR